MSTLVVFTADGKSRQETVIYDDLLFVQNFEIICRLSGIDPRNMFFVIEGKVYRYVSHR